MINPFTEINWIPGANDLKKFGRTVLIGLLVISAALFIANAFILKYPVFKSAYLPLILSASGGAVFIVSYFVKPLALPVYYIWFVAGASMGIVVSNLLLSLFFYFVLTPTGLALKYITGRNPLNLRQIKNQKSNWDNYSANKPLARYFKQY